MEAITRRTCWLLVVVALLLLGGQLSAQTDCPVWTKYEGNPVLVQSSPVRFDETVIGPSVIYDGTAYKMWYSGRSPTLGRGYRIGYATSGNGVNWTKVDGPLTADCVLDRGDSWDKDAGMPTVLYDEEEEDEGKRYKMWYWGHNWGMESDIGYAYSGDGIYWTKHQNNPVLQNGVIPEFAREVMYPSVIRDNSAPPDSLYKMWFVGLPYGSPTKYIGHAASPDGVDWGIPVVVLDIEDQQSEGFFGLDVFKSGSLYHMYYTSVEGGVGRVKHATSENGITWNEGCNSVLTRGGSGEWDSGSIDTPNIVFDGTTYKMWYTGSDGSIGGIGYATMFTVTVSDTLATYDESLKIPVRVSDTTHLSIVSAEVFVSYDSDLLTAWSPAVSTTPMTATWSIETNILEGVGTSIDTLKIAMATDEDTLSGAGDLIKLHFQVADTRHPASSPLTLEHVLFNDGTPGINATNGSVTLVGTDGAITSLPSEILPRWSVGVSVVDVDVDLDGAPGSDQVSVDIENTGNGDTVTLILDETAATAGSFTGTVDTEFGLAALADGLIQAQAGDAIIFTFVDELASDGSGPTDRTAQTDVIGGTDGALRSTVVVQAGDTVRVRVADGDLVDAVLVPVANSRTTEGETILLSQFSGGTSTLFGRVFTTAQSSSPGDSILQVARDDELVATYADTLTAVGGTAVLADVTSVTVFGDCDGNGAIQAFDAAKVLYHVLLHPDPPAIDTLACNLDEDGPFDPIEPYDASLILQKRVGLINRFPIQLPCSANHPQPETCNSSSPKRIPGAGERLLVLQPEDSYLSVWTDEREGIVSGELWIEGIEGQVKMGEELSAFLSASQSTAAGMQIVFAGAQGVSGPGELLRVAGVGPGDARLTRVSFNGGRIGARWEEGIASVRVPLAFVLHPNVPNPFNPETVIRFSLAQESVVRLEVFDVIGQRVRVLVGKQQPAGTHQVLWDGRGESGERVSSGVYFCRLQAGYEGGKFTQVRRMMLLK